MPVQILKEDTASRVEAKLPELYLVLALALTLLLCWMTPPFFAPDEPDHASRAISLLHGHLVEQESPDGAGDNIDDGVVHVMDSMGDIRMTWEKHAGQFLDRSYGPISDEQLMRQAGAHWTGQAIFEPFENTAAYPPLLYLPAMAGLQIGKPAGMTVYASLHLARMLSALCAVFLGWLAIRCCVGTRWLLFVCLLLPSVLYLNASCNQDALVPGLAALAVAMLSRALAARRQFTNVELITAAAALALIGMARPPYAVMALVLLLPALEFRSAIRLWLAPIAAVASVVGVTALWWRMVSALPLALNDFGDPDKQRSFLHAHPSAASLALLRGTTYAGYDFLHRGLYVIGLNDLLPHHGAELVLIFCFLAIVIAANGPVVETWAGRILLAIVVAAPLFGVSLAEYLIWTPPGGSTVFGIMPRYWLAAMPLGILLLQSFLPRREHWLAIIPQRIVMLAGVVLAMMACTLPWMVAHAYYREGAWHVLMLNFR